MASDLLVGIVVIVLLAWLAIAWRVASKMAQKGIIARSQMEHDLARIKTSQDKDVDLDAQGPTDASPRL